MIEFLDVVINGLSIGSIYLAAAIGLALTFGVLNILNFAHGELVLVAAYVGSFVLGTSPNHGPLLWIAAIGLAVAVAVVVAMVLQEGVLRRLTSEDHTLPLLVTFACAILIQGFIILFFSAQPIGIPTDIWPVSLGPISISGYRLVSIVAAVVASGLLWWWLNRTRSGTELRAVSDDPVGARSVGISVLASRRRAMLVVGALSGLAGFLMVPSVVLSPYEGIRIVLTAFVIVIVAGVGSIPAVVAVSFGLGILEAGVSFYSSLADAPIATFVLLLGILIIRPAGFRGRRTTEFR